MKNKQKDVGTSDKLSCESESAQIIEENIPQTVRAESLVDATAQEKKKEACKPIYLVRYE